MDQTSKQHRSQQVMKRPRPRYYTLTSRSTLGHDVGIERELRNRIPGLQKVQKLEDCDFILVFCPVVSRAGTDIDVAVKMLNTQPGDKPAVLLVLHHTFDPEYVPANSSRAVKRKNTLTVDCLFHEDRGLLSCPRNEEAMNKVAKWISLEEISIGIETPRQIKQEANSTVGKFFTITTANARKQHETIERRLLATDCLIKEDTAATCDFFLVFCTERDIKEAQHKLSIQSDNIRRAFLVVLHQCTSLTVPDNSNTVVRERTITVDCLLFEDQGLINCSRNSDALLTIENWPFMGISNERPRLNKYFAITPTNTCQHYKVIEKLHEVFPLTEVPTGELCDFILVFSAADEIKAVPEMLSRQPANKPALVIVLHTECTAENIGAHRSHAVDRANTLRVDCFFSETKLLHCPENDAALSEIINWRLPVEGRNPSKEIQNTIKDSTPLMGKTSHQVKYLTCLAGNALNVHVEFINILGERVSGLKEVHAVDRCDVILLFCPVVSRAGLDVEGALKKLAELHTSKPAVLVVLHHTFNPEFVAPDSSRAVTRFNGIAVDCLFYEDQGLLQCPKNNVAYTQVSCWIKAQVCM